VKAALFLFQLKLRPSERELAVRREIDLISRAATCIPENDAMVCGDGHYFNGRFTQTCPCGDPNAFTAVPTPIQARLAEVRRNG